MEGLGACSCPNCKRFCVTTPDLTPEGSTTEAALSAPQSSNWLDQDETLREMWLKNEPPSQIAESLGRSVAAIMTRAARLGLPRRSAPGRKPGYQRKKASVQSQANARERSVAVASHLADSRIDAGTTNNMPMVRICLMCLNKFPSEGRHNRICPSCKGSSEYSSGNSIPDMFKIEA